MPAIFGGKIERITTSQSRAILFILPDKSNRKFDNDSNSKTDAIVGSHQLLSPRRHLNSNATSVVLQRNVQICHQNQVSLSAPQYQQARTAFFMQVVTRTMLRFKI